MTLPEAVRRIHPAVMKPLTSLHCCDRSAAAVGSRQWQCLHEASEGEKKRKKKIRINFALQMIQSCVVIFPLQSQDKVSTSAFIDFSAEL